VHKKPTIDQEVIMPREGITENQVHLAADQLVREGELQPSDAKVRQKLGDTGSFTTIHKYMRTWWAKRLKEAVNDTLEDSLPPDGISQAAQKIWEDLTKQAHEKTAHIRQECEAKVVEVTQAIEQLTQEREEASKALEKANLKINHLESDITLIRRELVEERYLRKLAEEKARHKEELVNTLQAGTTKLMTELQNVQQESLQQLGQQLLTVQKHHEKDLKEWKTLVENQRTGFMVKLDELRTAKEKVGKLNSELKIELQQQLKRYQLFEEQIRRLETDIEITRQLQQEAEANVNTLRGETQYKDQLINTLLAQQKSPQVDEIPRYEQNL